MAAQRRLNHGPQRRRRSRRPNNNGVINYRRHAKDATAQMAELKAELRRVQKRLGKCRDKAGNRMPGWVVVHTTPVV